MLYYVKLNLLNILLYEQSTPLHRFRYRHVYTQAHARTDLHTAGLLRETGPLAPPQTDGHRDPRGPRGTRATAAARCASEMQSRRGGGYI